jgi:hypothetical protein
MRFPQTIIFLSGMAVDQRYSEPEAALCLKQARKPGVGLKPGSKPAQSPKNGLAATNKPKE